MEGQKPADVVFSTAGHDKDELFLVLSASEKRVLLCDGKLRKLQNPKTKSVRHIRFAGKANPELTAALADGSATDKAIRKELAIIRGGASRPREV